MDRFGLNILGLRLKKDPNGPGMSRSSQEILHKLRDTYCPGTGTCSLLVSMGGHAWPSGTLGQLIVGCCMLGLEAKIDGELVCGAGCMVAVPARRGAVSAGAAC